MHAVARFRKPATIAALVLIWGISWPIYKLALSATPPVLFAGMRTLLGGLVLLAVALPSRERLRLVENARIYALGTLFNAAIFYGAQTVGLTYLPEGVFSVVVYLEPILVGAFAWLWLGEAMDVVRVMGLVAGLVGVAFVSSESLVGTARLSGMGLALALVTAFSWTAGTVLVKGAKQKPDILWLAAVQFVAGGIALTAGGLLTERWSAIVWNPIYLTGLLFGGIFGIAAAWMLFFTLLETGEATQAASYTFLVPVIAVAAGVAFLGEPLTWGLLGGLVLIAFGIGMVNRAPGAAVAAAKGKARC